MLYCNITAGPEGITAKTLTEALTDCAKKLGDPKKVLALPPDFTRYHSRAGEITERLWDIYGSRLTDIIPATGTHSEMTSGEISAMFGGTPPELFRAHDWKKNLHNYGMVPGEFIREITEGLIDFDCPVSINRTIAAGNYDLIFSIGQVVPHEVAGMANYNKNIFVGAGGQEIINKSHYIGAVFGIERILGTTDNPVRRLFDRASDQYISHLPIIYILTVVGTGSGGTSVLRGLFIGDDKGCFESAARFSQEVNITFLDEPEDTIVVYLDPKKYKSTWLGNKAVYRSRMAIRDGGELVILAPGVKEFGEDREIDRNIRKYGYTTTGEILHAVRKDENLRHNLGAAAHLMHGTPDGRFSVVYCTERISKEEIESVRYGYRSFRDAKLRYDPEKLKPGRNVLGSGERIYFIPDPGLGLWAVKDVYFNRKEYHGSGI